MVDAGWSVIAAVGAALWARAQLDGVGRLQTAFRRPVSDDTSRATRIAVRLTPSAVAHAADLLSACLATGALLDYALATVAAVSDGDVATVLGATGRRLAMGAPIRSAWGAAVDEPLWAPIARATIRAYGSGAPLVDALTHAAADLRRAARSGAEATTRRAAVRAVLPLGICFLPAFVLVGVVPVVVGFAKTLWA